MGADETATLSFAQLPIADKPESGPKREILKT